MLLCLFGRNGLLLQCRNMMLYIVRPVVVLLQQLRQLRLCQCRQWLNVGNGHLLYNLIDRTTNQSDRYGTHQDHFQIHTRRSRRSTHSSSIVVAGSDIGRMIMIQM